MKWIVVKPARWRAFLLGALAALALCRSGSAQSTPPATPITAEPPVPGRYVVSPVRFAAPPVIDGKLDDAVWRTAAKLDGFKQLVPDEGQPATEPTDVFLGYDDENLYIGARCYDSEPAKVFATALARDSEIIYDDTLQVIFDTFRNGRNGFLFTTNSAGVEVDALVRNEGEEVNYNWDGIWTVRSTRDSGGWSTEMAIPWRTLRFPNAPEQDWGFNVERFVSRKQERSYWKPMRLAYGFYAPYKVSQFGELTGLAGVRTGSRYHFAPYLLAGGEQRASDDSTSTTGRLGGDLKVNVTSDLVADLTYRTDFSETEADEANVNLTRSPLLFPEKRAFFLEGASLFYFGDRPEPNHPNDENFLFFSRQIGLTPDGRAEIPLLGGVKMTGHEGPYDVGALSLQTEAVHKPDGYGGRVDEPRTTYSVLRMKRLVGDSSSFGVLGISKDATGDQNRVGGLDWDVSLGPSLRNGGYFAKSSTPGLSGRDWTGSTDFYWDSRNLRFHYVYTEVGENFNDELGYINRIGVRQYRADNNLVLWPERGPFRQAWLTYNFDYIADRATNQVQTRINNVQANAYFHNAAGISFKAYDDLEVLTTPLQIKRGLFIPPGSYEFINYFVGFQSDYTKAVGSAGQFAWGDYYDGHYFRAIAYANYRPWAGVLAELTVQRTQVDLKEGSFTNDILLGQLAYSFTPQLTTRLWVQWDRDASLREKLDVDWELRPGSHLFVVYQDIRSYVDFFDPRQPVFGTPGRQLLTKIVFLF